MRSRYLSESIFRLAFADHKMAFLSGPRQAGKTTLAKMALKERGRGSYFNWDDTAFRRSWTRDPKIILPQDREGPVPLLVLDEIHKAKFWKRSLKGLYDTREAPADILVTGSARLNVYNKGGDSLMGRYLNFRLHPFSLREMEGLPPSLPDNLEAELRDKRFRATKTRSENFASLMRFGPFPEPLFAQDEKKARLWRRGRVEKVIREDLRDISRLPDLSRIEMLASLLPEKVGSLFSLTSLREDLEVSHDTVRRWMVYLRELYYAFEIKPHANSVKRSLKKEGKLYLWDSSEVEKEPARFENLIAGHLLKACDFWTDTGEGVFELAYVRNKQKEELDFLITKDKKPWLPVEAKWSDGVPDSSWKKFLPALKVPFGVQVVAEPGHWKWIHLPEGEVLVASADAFLTYLV